MSRYGTAAYWGELASEQRIRRASYAEVLAQCASEAASYRAHGMEDRARGCDGIASFARGALIAIDEAIAEYTKNARAEHEAERRARAASREATRRRREAVASARSRL